MDGFKGGLREEPRFQMVGVVTDGRDACGVIHKVLSLKERFRRGRDGGEQSFSLCKRSFLKEICVW